MSARYATRWGQNLTLEARIFLLIFFIDLNESCLVNGQAKKAPKNISFIALDKCSGSTTQLDAGCFGRTNATSTQKEAPTITMHIFRLSLPSDFVSVYHQTSLLFYEFFFLPPVCL